MEIREVDWGVANHFGDFIEIHKDLKKFPKLRNQILSHELRHSDKTFSFQDLKQDWKDKTVPKWQLYMFMIRRPKTWIQFLPVYFQKDKGLIWDLNLILGYILFTILVVAILTFLNKIAY